jgi:hypothetical protein
MPPPGAGTVASLPILAHKSNNPIQSFAAGSAQHDITRYEHTFQRPGSIQSSWCARPAEAPAHWRLSLRYLERPVRYAPA